jgi:DNA-binding GntR family transcriptional regulator
MTRGRAFIGCGFRIDPSRPRVFPAAMLTPRPPDPNASAHERLYRSLRQQVMHGEMDPGQSLTLRGLGKTFGVSMTPAREAVRRLVAEGALTLSSSGRISTPELTPERIEELAAIRALLEPEMAARALPRAHFALIERLTAINLMNGEAAVRGDAVSYVRTNLEFHRTLYLRAQTPAMLAMCETVWLQLGPTMRAVYAKVRRREPPQHHRMILAALKAGDEPGLRLAVRTDVTQGLRHLAG